MGSSSPPRTSTPTAAAAAVAAPHPSSPSFSPSSSDQATVLRHALVAFYEVHNPSQLAESLLNEIVGKYLGKETQLLAKLRRRYGEAPKVPYLAGASGQNGGGGGGEGHANIDKMQAGGSPAVAAAAAAVPQQQQQHITDEDKRNLCSPHFDATVALFHHPQGALVPVPNAPPFDNILRCRHLLPLTHEDYMPLPQQSMGSMAAARREAMANSKAVIAAAKGPPLLERLAETLKKGPTALLYRCFTEKKRVVVMIRRIDGVRGTVTGELRAFDRHFNVVLGDAEEVFALPPQATGVEEEEEKKIANKEKPARTEQRKRGKRAGKKHKGTAAAAKKVVVGKEEITKEGEEEEKKKADDGLPPHPPPAAPTTSSVIRRSLPQVLIRGDNVVMVWEAKPGYVTHAIPSSTSTSSSSPAEPLAPSPQRKRQKEVEKEDIEEMNKRIRVS